MSFITEMIHSMMEDPESLRSNMRTQLKKVDKGAKAYRENRDKGLRMDEWWKQPQRSFLLTSEMMACEGNDGKGTKYMATATSRANSLQSILDAYDRQERAKQDAAQAAVDRNA